MRTRVHLALAALGVVAMASSAMAGDGPTIGGQLEANYTYNFNKPSTRNNTYLFNTKDSEFTVNLGEVSLKKAADDKTAGYTLRLITGRVQEWFHAAYNTNHVLEAYGTTHHEMGGKQVSMDFGQFLPGVGTETPDQGSSAFFTKSFSYQYLLPKVQAGVRLGIPMDDKSTLTAMLVNRLDGVTDNSNRDLGFGLKLSRKLGENASWSLAALTARENMAAAGAAVANRDTNLVNFVYSRQLSESVGLGIDATSRSGKDLAKRTYNATGIAGTLSKKLASGNSLSVRGEYLSQNNATSGILPAYPADPTRKPSLTSITAAYAMACSEGSSTTLEFRLDNAGGAIFPATAAGTAKKQQTSVTLSRVFKF